MSLPNYSAELSLPPRAESYAGVANLSQKTGGRGVEPQFCRCNESGYCTCITCSDGFCWTHSFHIYRLQ